MAGEVEIPESVLNRLNNDLARTNPEIDDVSGLRGLPGVGDQGVVNRLYGLESEVAKIAPRQNVGNLYNPSNGEYSTYDQDVETLEDLANIDDFRARNQSNFVKGLNAIIGGVATGIGTAAENLSYIFDIDEHLKGFRDIDGVEGNAFSTGAKDYKQWIDSIMPIYERPATGFADSFFRWSTLKSGIDSMVGFAIPGGVVTKTVGMAAKALRGARLAAYLSRLGSVGNTIGKGLNATGRFINYGTSSRIFNSAVSGFLTNDAEGKMMALEMKDNADQNYISRASAEILKGKYNNNPEYAQQAIQEAQDRMANDEKYQLDVAQRQDEFVNRNRVFMLTDMFGLHGIFKGKGLTRNILRDPETYKFWNSTKKLNADNWLLQMTKEGAEEIGQNVLQSEAEYQIARASGNLSKNQKHLEDKSAFERALEFATSDQALVEGAMGFLSGGLQRHMTQMAYDLASGDTITGANRKVARLADYERQQDELAKYTIQTLRNTVQGEQIKTQAEAEGNSPVSSFVTDTQFAKQMTSAFEMGTTEQLERTLNDIANMSPEQAREYGYEQSYKEDAIKRIQQLQKSEKTWLRYSGFANQAQIFDNRVTSDNLVDLRENLQDSLNEAVNTFERKYQTYSYNPDAKNPIQVRTDYPNAELETNEDAALVQASPEAQEVYRIRGIIEQTNDTIKQLDKEFKDITSEEFAKKVAEARKALEEQAIKDAEKQALAKKEAIKDNLKEDLREAEAPEIQEGILNNYREEAKGDPIVQEAIEEAVIEVSDNTEVAQAVEAVDKPLMYEDLNRIVSNIAMPDGSNIPLNAGEAEDAAGISNNAQKKAFLRRLFGAVPTDQSYNPEVNFTSVRRLKDWLDSNPKAKNPVSQAVLERLKVFADEVMSENARIEQATTTSIVAPSQASESDFSRNGDVIQSRETIRQIESTIDTIVTEVADSNRDENEPEGEATSTGTRKWKETRAANSYNSVAYLSRPYSTSYNENGDIVKRDIGNSLLVDEAARNALNPDLVKEGKPVTFEVIDDDNIMVSTPEVTGPVSWGEYKNRVMASELTQEARDTIIRNKIPIHVKVDGKVIGFIHDTDWVNQNNVYTDLDTDLNNLIKTRQAILDGALKESIISKRTLGFLAKRVDGEKVPFNEAFANKNLHLAIKKDTSFIGQVDSNMIGNISSRMPSGFTYVVLPSKNSGYAVPLYRAPLDRKYASSISNAVRIYLDAKSGSIGANQRRALKEIAKAIKGLKDENQQPINLDVTSTAGLRNYISLFTYLHPTEKMDLGTALQSKPRDYRAFSVEENRNTIVISYGEGKGVNVKTLKIEKEGPNAGKVNGPLDFIEGLEEHLMGSSFYSNAKYLSLSGNLQIPYIGSDGSVAVETSSYEDLLKANTYTDILETNIGSEESPQFVYFSQPKIEFVNKIVDEVESEETSIEEKVSKSEEKSTDKVFKSSLLGDIDLTQSFDDSIDLSIGSLSAEDFSVFNKSQEGIGLISSNIKALKLTHQRQLVDIVSKDLMVKTMDTQGKMSGEQVATSFDTWKEEFTAIRDAALKVNNTKVVDNLNELLNNWSNFTKIVKDKISAVGGFKIRVNENSDEISDIEGEEASFERTRFSDSFTLEVDSKDTVSFRVKQFLAGIENPNKRFYLNRNITMTESFDTVYNTVQAILASTKPSFEAMVNRLQEVDNIAWMPNLIEKLLKAPQQVKNEFVVAMNKHYVHMIFAMTTEDGRDYTMQVWDTNANSIAQTITDTWYSHLTTKPLVALKDGIYVYNPEVVKEIKDEYNSWIASRKVPSPEVLRDWLDKMGITLSPGTLDALVNGEFVYNNIKYSYDQLFGKNTSLFGDIVSRLKPNEDITTTQNALLGSSIVKALISLEAKNTLRVFSNSHRSGTKTIYSYTNDKYVMDRFFDLQNTDKLEQLAQLPFNKESYWLKLMTKNGKLNKDSKMFKEFDMQYLALDALKKRFSRTLDDNDLANLSPAEHEAVKLTMFFNNDSRESGPSGQRVGKFFYPTMSDKSAMFVVTSILYNTSINQDGSLTSNVIDFIYDNVVQSEINRILDWQATTQNGANPLDIDAYNNGASKFLLFPQLNNIEEIFRTDTHGNRILRENVVTNEELQALIKERLAEILNAIVDDQVRDWAEQGLSLQFDEDNRPKFKFVDKKYLNYVNTQANTSTLANKNRFIAADYALNNIISNANIFQLFIGDPALYYKSKSTDPILAAKDTFINIGKRLAGDNAPGMEADFSKISPRFKLAVVKDTERPSISNEYYKRLGLDKEYSKINGSDAQELTTASEHIDVMYAFGKLSEEDYNTIKQKLADGEDLNTRELSLVMQPIKPVYVANDIVGNVDIRRYVKSSSFPLLPQVTKGLELDKVRQMMESKGIQRLAFESAVKIGAPRVRQSIINTDGTLNDESISKITPIELSREGFKIQQEVPYHEDKDAINRGTQESKLLFANIKEIGGFKYKGKEYSGAELEKVYTDTYRQIFERKLNSLYDELEYNPETGNLNVKKLESILQNEAITRGYPINDLLGLSLNENGQFKFPLWSLPSAQKYESLLLAIADNRVRKIKLPGMSYVLGTQEGFKVIREEDEAKQVVDNLANDIVWTSSWTGELLSQRYSEDGSEVLPSQVLVPSKIRDNRGRLIDIKKYARRDESGRLMLDEEAIPKDLLKIFGFRIPTQGHSSMMNMEIVGFLPDAVGDLCIASRDLTIQMGSDFDVDKLYTYNYSLASIKRKDSKVIFKKVNDLTGEESSNLMHSDSAVDKLLSDLFGDDITKEDSIELKKLYNDLLDMHLAVIQNPNEDLQKMISSPIGFGNLKGGDGPEGNLAFLINNWREARNPGESAFSGLSAKYQRSKFINATAGKAGVAVFSSSMVFIASAQGKGLQYVILDDDKRNTFSIRFGDKVSNGDLSGIYAIGTDRPRTKVMEAFQSASVDNEKEQILDKLNINTHTFNAINALVMMGFEEKEVASIIAQDSVFEYVNKMQAAQSQLADFIANPKEEIYNEIWKSLYDKAAANIIGLTEDSFRESIKSFADASADTLLKFIKNGETESSYYAAQAAALEKFIELDNIGSQILRVQSAINTDSKGFGKSFISSMLKQERILDLPLINKSGVRNADRLIGNYSINEYGQIEIKDPTLLGSSVVYGLNPVNQLFSRYFPYQRLAFQQAVDSLAVAINPYQQMSSSSKEKLAANMFESMKSYLFSDRNLFGISDINEERRRLLIDVWSQGDNNNQSLATRIDAIQATPYGQSNQFLNRLQTRINKNGEPSTVTYNAAAGVNLDESAIYQGFTELLATDASIPVGNQMVSLRELGKDLITYAYLTGGIQRAREFIRYVPIDILDRAGFGDILNAVNFNDTASVGVGGVNDGTPYNTLGDFERQYIQHNPEALRAKLLGGGDKGGTIETADLNNITVLSSVNINGAQYINSFRPTPDSPVFIGETLDGQALYAEYVSVRTRKRGYLLYHYNGDSYERIPTLGFRDISEYQLNSLDTQADIAKSIFPERNVGVLETVRSSARPQATGEIQNNYSHAQELRESFGLLSRGSSTPSAVLANIALSDKFTKTPIEEKFYEGEKGSTLAKVAQNMSEIYSKSPINDRVHIDLSTEMGSVKGAVHREGENIIVSINARATEEEAARTLVHELSHAILLDVLDAKNFSKLNTHQRNLVRRIEALRELATDQLNPRDMEALRVLTQKVNKFRAEGNLGKQIEITPAEVKVYGAYNTQEFVAAALTNPEFRQILQSIRAGSESVWDKLSRFLRNVLETLGLYKAISTQGALKVSEETIFNLMQDSVVSERALPDLITYNLEQTDNVISKLDDIIQKGSSFNEDALIREIREKFKHC